MSIIYLLEACLLATPLNPSEFLAPESLSQIPAVSQLAEVKPTDWAFQALQSLIQRYGITMGDHATGFSDHQPMTRDEFAAALQAVLTTLHRSVTVEPAMFLTPDERKMLQRLQADFAPELGKLNQRLTRLKPQIETLEAQQFSPTTTLSGEIIIGLSDDVGDNTGDNLALQQRTKLSLTSSFTGKDRLKISLRAGNFEEFSFVGNLTNEGRLGFRTDSENAIEVSNLSYQFPVGKRIRVFIAPDGDDVPSLNPLFEKRGTGSISRFGRKNPIYRLIESGGLGLTYTFSDTVKIDLGYYAGDPEDGRAGNGLFNGNYSGAVRLEWEPSDRLTVGLMYIHSYSDSNLRTVTGSLRSQIDLDRPVVGNSYSLETSYQIDPQFIMGGWIGYTDATVLNLGEAKVLNYALTIAFPDVGKPGNLLGFIIGQEPRLTGTSGFTIDGRRRDPDISFHIEALYRYQVSDHISITPGVIWITAPNHDHDNSDIAVFTVRTTLEF